MAALFRYRGKYPVPVENGQENALSGSNQAAANREASWWIYEISGCTKKEISIKWLLFRTDPEQVCKMTNRGK